MKTFIIVTIILIASAVGYAGILIQDAVNNYQYQIIQNIEGVSK